MRKPRRAFQLARKLGRDHRLRSDVYDGPECRYRGLAPRRLVMKGGTITSPISLAKGPTALFGAFFRGTPVPRA